MKKKAPFWEKGIRFECQGSGKCCTSRGSYGYIYLTLADRRRLAKHMGIRTAEFTRTYCEVTDGFTHLKEPSKNCQFLAGKRCTVYEARPVQCRTWPFWPENMKPRTWDLEVAAFCPGVGKGKLYTKEEIQAILGEESAVSSS